MHFDPDGQRLWAQTIASLRSWDATSGKQLGQREGPRGTSVAHHVAFSPDGKRVAVGFRGRVADSRSVAGIKVFEADTLKQLYSLPGLGPMVFSPDGQRLAGPGVDPTVKVWDVSGAGAGKELQSWPVQSGAIACLAFSADGRLLACGTLDRGLSVWDAVAGRQRFQCRGHTGGVRGLAFRPDGRHLASASEDRTVRIWDTTSGEEVRTLCGTRSRC